MYTPYQSLGARGVNNLAARLVLALLPPSSAFFRLKPRAKDIDQLKQEDKTAIDKALSMVEQEILKEMEARTARVVAHEAMKHLIVGGNVLLDCHDKRIRLFHLSQYVVRRDPSGNVLEIVIEESITPDEVPESVRDEVKQKIARPEERAGEQRVEKVVKLYTHIEREADAFKVYQEVCGVVPPESQGSYPLERLPYLALRWSRLDGEDYGRSHAEDYIGDLVSSEGLSKAIVELAAVSAKSLFLVDPSGQTQISDLQDAPNGAIRPGRKTDVEAVSVEKFADMQVAKTTLDAIEQRLAFAFMLNSAIQRNAERVTAEEIRYMIQELENSFGGVYSILSQEFQTPLVRVIMADMTSLQQIPNVIKVTSIAIVTGLDALGRSQDVSHLRDFIGTLQATFGPEIVARYVSVSEYASRLAAGMGVQSEALIRTEQQIAEMNNVTANQQLVEKLGPSAIRELGNNYRQNNEQPTPAATG